jgi:hypothetical protein
MIILKIIYIFSNLKDYFIFFIPKKNWNWGLGIGDWGLGIGPNPQSPIPNPQSPIPNPHVILNFILCFKNNKKKLNNKKILYLIK